MARLTRGSRASRALRSVADFFDRNQILRNRFYEAFYNLVGASYTRYDPKAPTYVDEGYNKNPDVYSVLTQMASKTMAVPFEVKRVKDEESSKKFRTHLKNNDYFAQPFSIIKRIRLYFKAFEEKTLPFPMKRPNTRQTWEEFWGAYKVQLRLTGNCFIYLVSPEDGPNAGMPLQAHVLPGHLINIVLKKNSNVLYDEDPIDYYMLIEGETYTKFPAQDVIHIKMGNPNFDYNGRHLYGQSPLAAALYNIQSSNEGMQNNIKTMKNGGAFGIIHGKGEPLDEEHATQLKERMKEMDLDTERLSKYAGVSAEIGFTRLSLNHEELKPFEYLKYDQKQICNVLGWSDLLLNNDSRGDYGGTIGQIRRQMITDNIGPDLELLARSFKEFFLPRFKGYENTDLIFDTMQLPEMQQDTEKLVGWLTPLLDRGVINRNELRVAIGYTTDSNPLMEEYTVASSTLMTLEDVLINKAEPIEVEGVTVNQIEEAKLLKSGFNPNQPRDRRGRWTDSTTGESGSTYAIEDQMKAHEEFGGSSYGQTGENLIGKKGFAAVAMFPDRSITISDALTPEALEAFYDLNEDLLSADPDLFVGTWLDPETGITWLDLSKALPKEEAIELGKELNQISIFDLENVDTIDTGGTGEKKDAFSMKLDEIFEKTLRN